MKKREKIIFQSEPIYAKMVSFIPWTYQDATRNIHTSLRDATDEYIMYKSYSELVSHEGKDYVANFYGSTAKPFKWRDLIQSTNSELFAWIVILSVLAVGSVICFIGGYVLMYLIVHF